MMKPFLIGTGVGALLTYLLDPVWGEERRQAIRTWATSGRGASGPSRSEAVEHRPEDDTLTLKVESLIRNETGLGPDRVQVRAESGVVELRGGVGTDEELEAVRSAAHSVQGVLYIRNLLQVASSRDPDRAPHSTTT